MRPDASLRTYDTLPGWGMINAEQWPPVTTSSKTAHIITESAGRQ